MESLLILILHLGHLGGSINAQRIRPTKLTAVNVAENLLLGLTIV